MKCSEAVLLGMAVCATSSSLFAQAQNEPLTIVRAAGPIVVDGNLDDEGWRGIKPIDKWYETNPGDNIEPGVKSVGYLAYDDRFFYAAFELADPQPAQIRAPYNDRDNVGGNTDDYAGVILDTRNDRKTAVMFLANARGIQYDAITDDSSGEDSSPDFFWDSVTRITPTGWTLEIRIPFSSLRYKQERGPQEWGILLYRNRPRDRRYQMFSGRLPRGGNCFICNRNPLTGLSDLPTGGNIVAAPYVTARAVGEPRGSVLGNEFVNRPVAGDAGLDVKWIPNADMALDATVNPDFSQVEADVAAISTNERFAIFFPEKRPFFLEGIELFSTPIQAAYTRTITSPRWGLRTTGKRSDTAYTLLIAQDRGGGDVVIPSPLLSRFAFQDFSSIAAIGRARRDFGTSFVSGMVTARENQGGGYNRVLGPDFRWRIGQRHTLTGQLLFSDTREPNRPALSSSWDGEQLRSHAGHIWYQFNTRHVDFFTEYRDFGDEFRADNGFVPQVGFRSNFAEGGYTWRPEKQFFNRVRAFSYGAYDSKQDGALLYRFVTAGVSMDGRYQSFIRLRLQKDAARTGDAETGERVLERDRLYYTFEVSPSKRFARITLNGWLGDDIDFVRHRLGRGADIALTSTLRPNDHLQVGVTSQVRWLSIAGDRLFTSQLERIKATYTFNSRMFLRTVVQNTRTNRDVRLYDRDLSQHAGGLSSQLLFAYKLNWQTVLYLGAGDLREVTAERGELEPSERQIFTKVSYAFQR